MKLIQVEVVGVTPLMQNKYEINNEVKGPSRKMMVQKEDPREVAKRKCHMDEDGVMYINAFAIPGAMKAAGSNHKMRGSRKSLRFVVPSAVMMVDETIPILDAKGDKYKTFEVDSRPATIPATKGTILVHRPRWNSWMLRFGFKLNDDFLDEDTAHQLLTEAGMAQGIGCFRPNSGGPFGTFRVTSFKVV